MQLSYLENDREIIQEKRTNKTNHTETSKILHMYRFYSLVTGQYRNWITLSIHIPRDKSFNYTLVKCNQIHITSHIQGVDFGEARDSNPCTAAYHSHVYQELLLSPI